MSAQTQLTKVETAIEALLDGITGDTMQEYTYRGRMYKRADWPGLIRELEALQAALTRRVRAEAMSGTSRVGVVKLGRANRSS